MRKLCSILFLCLCFTTAKAATIISATLSITNAAALTNATSGQSYTLNSDTRTFTNSVASPSTQIRVLTNDTASTILLSLVNQAGLYPFADVASMTTSSGTNVTFRAPSGTTLTIMLSPTNWGTVSYSTQTIGSAQTIVRVPYTGESAATRTNVANGLVDWLNSDENTNRIASGKLSGSTVSVGGTNVSSANLADSASLTWGVSGSNITATVATSGFLTNFNLLDSATFVWAQSAVTNISGYPTNLTDAQIASGAAIDRSKLAAGTANHVLINDGSGVPSSEAQLALSRGGTGVNLTDPGTNSFVVWDDSVNSNRFATIGSGLSYSGGIVSSSSGTTVYLNGISVSNPNFTNSSTAIITAASTTNISVYPTNLGNAQIASGAAIARTKLAPVLGYIVLASPSSVDGSGCVFQTTNTLPYFGQALMSGTAATNANFIEYRLTVPEDLDPSVDLKVVRWKFRFTATDTNSMTFNIGMDSVGEFGSYDSTAIDQWVTLPHSGNILGDAGRVATVSNVTLTDWKSNVSGGDLWVIRINRDGASDASNFDCYSGPLVISYGRTE